MKPHFLIIALLTVFATGATGQTDIGVEKGDSFEILRLPDGRILKNAEVLSVVVILDHDGGVETVEWDTFQETVNNPADTLANVSKPATRSAFSGTAFETLKFGDNTKEVFKKLKKLDIVDRIDTSGVNFVALINLAGRRYFLYPHFKNKALSVIRIRSEYREADEFDEYLRLDWEYLRNLVINRFGLPTQAQDFPKTPYFPSKSLHLTDDWKGLHVGIQLGVKIIEDKYYAVAYISSKRE